MTEVGLSDLKKHRFYMMYYANCESTNGQTIYFFAIRSKCVCDHIDIVTYGHINNDNPTKQVISNYLRLRDQLSVSAGINFTIFELDMDDFAMHIASETI